MVSNGEGWIYFPTLTPGVLGTAIIWSNATGCSATNLIVDDGAGALAHAATAFATPEPRVWLATERSLSRAEPIAPTIPPPPMCADFTAELIAAGLDVVADHGVWIGEINGLEVARVGMRDGACAIDIGVGAYDQFASAALSPDRNVAESLAKVVSMVEPHRTAASAPHAIGRLVRARWLRAQLLRSPGLIGLDSVNPIPLIRERPGLNESQPAAALGVAGDKSVLVTCAVGLDLGIAETAAGLIALHEPDELVVVLPPRDQHQRITDAVNALAVPSRIVAIEGEWS